MEPKSLFRQYVIIFIVVSSYWIVSIITVFLNKLLLADIHFDAPNFVTFFQVVTSTVIWFFIHSLNILDSGETHVRPFHIKTIKALFPVSVLFTAMVVTNNLCLKHVSIAFYYIGRSLTTIFNVIFTYLILGERTSAMSIVCCLIIIIGFLMGSDQEHVTGSLTLSGSIFGILGSLFLSLYSIYTKRALPVVNQQVSLFSYYVNLYSIFLFIPIIILNGEIPNILNFWLIDDPQFWLIMVIGGLCGFSIGFLTSQQIKVTSALTHNVSGTAKACTQTVLATYLYDQHKSFLWWFSNFVVLFGSAGYARIKQLDMKKRHRQNPVYTKA